MELPIAAVLDRIVLGLGLLSVACKLDSSAVDNLLDWLIHNFG